VATLVDSHCHLNFEPLQTQVAQVLDNARQAGVGYMLCVGVTIEAFPEVRALAQAHANVFASVGVHPNEREGSEPTAGELVTLARDNRVVAIGETGLDYYRCEGDLGWQQERFRTHIAAAKQSGKPLIIHTRESAADTLRLMREESAGEARGVMHCFTESWEVAKAALDMDFYISFSGIVTFKSAEALRDVARRVPAERLLIETDAPYLAPVPYRGKTNEPSYVKYVADCVAEVRGVESGTIAEQTTANFFELFRAAVPV
jgi:TatD DNase family protein